MDQEEHFRKLEQMYLGAPINAFYRPSIQITTGKAVIKMKVQEKFFHAAHALHGAVYFKMLDDAAFFAANSLVTETFVLTTDFHIHLFRPVFGGEITAKGNVLFSSRNLFVAEAKLFSDENKVVAHGTGNFMRSHIPLTSDIGYV